MKKSETVIELSNFKRKFSHAHCLSVQYFTEYHIALIPFPLICTKSEGLEMKSAEQSQNSVTFKSRVHSEAKARVTILDKLESTFLSHVQVYCLLSTAIPTEVVWQFSSPFEFGM